MKLARVKGTVWATQKIAGLSGYKLLLIQPLSYTTREPVGRLLVAVDTVQAGQDDTVFFVTSREASLPIDPAFVPVDATIMGIVDEITVHRETTHFH